MRRTAFLIITFTVVVLDWITKQMIVSRFDLYEAVPVIENFFQLVYVQNTGAAFGIGANSGSSWVPLLLNFGALAVFGIVAIYAYRSPATDKLLQVGLHLILGGAIGNLIDRFRLGYVIDFLDFYVVIGGKAHHWPAFNVADSAICVGIALLFIDMWRKPDQAESRVGAAGSAP